MRSPAPPTSVLRDSQASLERAQAIAQLGSWEWDLSRRHMEWSTQMYRFFALDPLQPPPAWDRLFTLVHPEDRAGLREVMEEVIANGEPRSLELRIHRVDGEVRHMHFRAEAERDGLNRPRRLRGTLQDITDRRQAEEALENLGRLSAKGQMAAYIAHAINNPLAGIRNAVELLSRAVPAEHPYAPYSDLIKREVDHIAGIIRTMYHVYRAPDQVSPEVGLHQTFQDIEHLLAPRSRSRGVMIVISLQNLALRLQVNEGLLREVLFDLVQNAIDASPPGGVVTLGAFPSRGRGIVTVENEGPGIPPEVAARIFQPGFTTKRDSNMNGLGLGLHACRNLVASMGGSLQFTSGKQGKGTVFMMDLPLQDDEVAAPPKGS